MTELTYSRHAESRMSQRGIGRPIVELILTDGTKIGRGRMMLKRRKASMLIQVLKKQQRVQKDLKIVQTLNKQIALIERSKDKVIVVNDGHLVTAYHQKGPVR